MIVPKNINPCISSSGEQKTRFLTDKDAIETAKYWNERKIDKNSRLIAYKCPTCHGYHLFTKVYEKNIR